MTKPVDHFPDPQSEEGAAQLVETLEETALATNAIAEQTGDPDTPVKFTVHYRNEDKMYPTSPGSALSMDTHNGWIPLPYEKVPDEPAIEVRLAIARATIRDHDTSSLFAVSEMDTYEGRPALRATLTEQGYGDPDYVGRQRHWPREDLTDDLVYRHFTGTELSADRLWDYMRS